MLTLLDAPHVKRPTCHCVALCTSCLFKEEAIKQGVGEGLRGECTNPTW